jgi:hypothetical protein
MTLQIRSVGSDEQQDRYQTTIEQLLIRIRTTTTGTIVINRVENSARRVRIVPFGRSDVAEHGFNNAVTLPMSEEASGTFGAGAAAAGTRSEIHFSVGNLRTQGVQAEDHEVLLHELCHSLRQISGVERYVRDGAAGRDLLSMAGGFDTVEEFFAAMVTSVYSSELGRPPLGNHDHASIPNPEVLRNPPFSARLAEFRQRMPNFVADPAAIPRGVARFNPFRDVP